MMRKQMIIKLFRVPVTIAKDRVLKYQRLLANWLQLQAQKVPPETQQLVLIIFCALVTAYCISLILQPFINN